MPKGNLKNETNELKNAYEKWLIELVETKQTTHAHIVFLDWLHRHHFQVELALDDNREADGRILRNRFEGETNFLDYSPLFVRNCTMLEMIIALADRINYVMSDYPKTSIGYWFWIMINNVGFQIIDTNNEEFDKSQKENEVRLYQLLDRKYQSDGRGGLFPLKNPKRDQRTTEIWYQMQAWIQEQE